MGFTEQAFNEQTHELVIQFTNVSEPLTLRYRYFAYDDAFAKMSAANEKAREIKDEAKKLVAFARSHAQFLEEVVSEWSMEENTSPKKVVLTVDRIAQLKNFLLVAIINEIIKDVRVVPLIESRSPAGLSLVPNAAAN